MDRVRLFLSTIKTEDIPLPWKIMKSSDQKKNERTARIKAIEEHLGDCYLNYIKFDDFILNSFVI